jgi:hypothetical protein
VHGALLKKFLRLAKSLAPPHLSAKFLKVVPDLSAAKVASFHHLADILKTKGN